MLINQMVVILHFILFHQLAVVLEEEIQMVEMEDQVGLEVEELIREIHLEQEEMQYQDKEIQAVEEHNLQTLEVEEEVLVVQEVLVQEVIHQVVVAAVLVVLVFLVQSLVVV